MTTTKLKKTLLTASPILSLLLIIALVATLTITKPWDQESDRTISINGTATVKAEPDEYVFFPNYQVTNADRDAAIADIANKSQEVTTKLNDLGVSEENIKVSTSVNEAYYLAPEDPKREDTHSTSFTITVDSKDLAQKVSNYILSAGLSGMTSPQGGFSENKQKELKSQARDQAIADAKKQAEQNVKSFGAKLGKVKSIQDNNDSMGVFMPMEVSSRFGAADSTQSSPSAPNITIMPGQNEISYQVQVTFYLK